MARLLRTAFWLLAVRGGRWSLSPCTGRGFCKVQACIATPRVVPATKLAPLQFLFSSCTNMYLGLKKTLVWWDAKRNPSNPSRGGVYILPVRYTRRDLYLFRAQRKQPPIKIPFLFRQKKKKQKRKKTGRRDFLKTRIPQVRAHRGVVRMIKLRLLWWASRTQPF